VCFGVLFVQELRCLRGPSRRCYRPSAPTVTATGCFRPERAALKALRVALLMRVTCSPALGKARLCGHGHVRAARVCVVAHTRPDRDIVNVRRIAHHGRLRDSVVGTNVTADNFVELARLSEAAGSCLPPSARVECARLGFCDGLQWIGSSTSHSRLKFSTERASHRADYAASSPHMHAPCHRFDMSQLSPIAIKTLAKTTTGSGTP
jgi:hypothetical protein